MTIGRDIENGDWVIYGARLGARMLYIENFDHTVISDYEWFDKFWNKISARGDKGITPYNLRNCAYLDDFDRNKIVWASVGANEYCFVPKGMFLLDTNYFAIGLNKFHLAILNSRLIIKKFIEETDTKVGTIAYRHYKYNFEKIPIPKIATKYQIPFEKLADEIIEKKKNEKDTTALEHQIDVMVYKLYELTYKEILIVDEEFPMSEVEYNNFVL